MFGKHCCTGGQGGVVYTKSEDLYCSTRRASDRGKPFGLPAGCTNSIASLNLNLNDLAAAIGREQLKKLPWVVCRRREIVARLQDGLSEIGTVKIPEGIPGAEASYWFLRMEIDTTKLTCDKDNSGDSIELKVGTDENQHLVAIEPQGKGCKFALVRVEIRGEDDTI
jgi:dTDP-4-amino-4,6-dideoxygalactose transaminase